MSGPADLLGLDRALDVRDDEADARDEARRERGAGAWWRRHRTLVLVVVVLLLGVAVSVATATGAPGEPLDPDNPAPEGAQAVARILEREGVEVLRQDDLATVLAEADADETVLVLDSEVLRPDNLRALRGTEARLVLVQPGLPTLRVLAPELSLGGAAAAEVVDPQCDAPDAVAAGDARAGGSRYVPSEEAVPGVDGEQPSPDADVVVCYPSGGGSRPDAGSYAVVTDGDRQVVVLGQEGVLRNETLAQAGNAALALRALGEDPVLHWYRASPLDPALDAGGERTVSPLELLPRWVRWVGIQLLVVLAVAVVWRSRRLGRLVPERLPAVVRSVETTEGRARLYRAAGARGTSARVLRRASVRRLASRLGAGRSPDARAVARLAADATGRDPTAVATLLLGPDPTDDAGLVRLADDLDTLEREVARR
ncbi:DUF4350 domain-containing protein [Aquipuribacter nitratireducens]|uniref:DUF4350 domain-containing protein n=1 Tax=Aquipuribacter nitratireducens TaxID=650104 RepID=A0ABW0GMA3_9MICO